MPENQVTITVKLDADEAPKVMKAIAESTDGTIRAFQKLNNTTKKTQGHFSDIAKGVFAGNAALAALRKGINAVQNQLDSYVSVIQKSIEAANAMEEAESGLTNALLQSGQTLLATEKAILANADALQRLTGVSNDTIVGYSKLLVSFGATEKQTITLTEKILDMSIGMGRDASAAAILFGKALKGEFGTVSEYGLILDQSLSKQEKFNKLLEFIQTSFGGAAAANAKKFGGAINILTAEFTDLQKEIGFAFTKNKDFLAIIEDLQDTMEGWVKTIRDARGEISAVANVVTDEVLKILPAAIEGFIAWNQAVILAVGVFGQFLLIVKQIADFLGAGKFLTLLGLLAGAMLALAVKAGLVTTAFALWLVAINLILAALLTLAHAVGAIDATSFAAKMADLAGAADAVGDALQGAGEKATNAFQASKFNTDEVNAKIKQLVDEYDRLNLQTEHYRAINSDAQVADNLEKELLIFNLMVDILTQAIIDGVALNDVINRIPAAFEVASAAAEAHFNRLRELRGGKGQSDTDTPEETDASKAADKLREEAKELRITIGVIEEYTAAKKDTLKLDNAIQAALDAEITGNQELANEVQKLRDKKKELEAVQVANLQAGQDQQKSLKEEATLLKAQIAAVKSLTPELATQANLQRALNEAELESIAIKAGLLEETKDQIQQILDARDELATIQTQKEAEHELVQLQDRISLMKEVVAGTLSYKDALKGVRVQELLNQGVSAETAFQLATLEEEYTQLTQSIEETTVDLGQSLDEIFGGIVDGILLSTREGVDAMEIMKDAGIALFADMFKKILKDKLGFDAKFQANFLRDLPSTAAEGVGRIGNAFSSLFSGEGVGSAIGQLTSSSGGGANILTSISQGGAISIGTVGVDAFGSVGGLNAAFAGSTAGSLEGVTFVTGGVDALELGITEASVGVGGPQLASSGKSVLSGSSGGAGIGSAIGTFGIALAALSAIESLAAISAVDKKAGFALTQDDRAALGKSALGGSFTGAVGGVLGLEDVGRALDKFQGGIDGLSAGEVLEGALAEQVLVIFTGGLGNVLVGVSGGIFGGKTRGTIFQKFFEDFIENVGPKDNPILGNTFSRGLAFDAFQPFREEVEERLGIEGNLFGNTTFDPTGQHRRFETSTTLGFRGAIDDFAEQIGLTEKQISRVVGLGAAFRGVVGERIDASAAGFSLSGVTSLLGNLAATDATPEQTMHLIGEALRQLGPLSAVLPKLNEFFQLESNDITVSNYRDAIIALSEATFTDLPPGVDAARLAIELLDEAFTESRETLAEFADQIKIENLTDEEAMRLLKDLGDQGIVTFEELQEKILAAASAGTILGPVLSDLILGVATSDAALGDAPTKGQLESQFIDTIEKEIAGAVVNGLIEGFIQSSLQTAALEPFFMVFNDAMAQVAAEEITIEEATALIDEEFTHVRSNLEQLMPLIQRAVDFGLQLSEAFGLFADNIQTAADAAKALSGVTELHGLFDQRLTDRVEFLRTGGQATPGNLRNRADTTRADAVEIARLVINNESNQNFPLNERLAAIGELEELIEKEHELRVQALAIETQLVIDASQERITALQRESDEIQRNANLQIEAKQEELDLLNDQIVILEQWKAIGEQLRDQIRGLLTGQSSPLSPLARFGISQEAFNTALSDFRGATTDESRLEAAQRVSDLGSEFLAVAEGIFPQGSEGFRSAFNAVIAALDEVRDFATDETQDLLDLQERANELSEEIKTIQQETKEAIDAITEAIRQEELTIRDAQDKQQVELEKINLSTAAALEWIQGQGNAIFIEKENELREKLRELGEGSVDLEDINAGSFLELIKIRRILSGEGIDVNEGHPLGSVPGGGRGVGRVRGGIPLDDDPFDRNDGHTGPIPETIPGIGGFPPRRLGRDHIPGVGGFPQIVEIRDESTVNVSVDATMDLSKPDEIKEALGAIMREIIAESNGDPKVEDSIRRATGRGSIADIRRA